MKNSFNILKLIVKDEFRKIIGSRITILLYAVFPIVIFLSFSLVYQKEIIREIPVAIFDDDNSDLSKTIIKYVASSPSMEIVEYVNSIGEAKDEMLRGKIQGFFYLPPDLSLNIKSGKQANAFLFINSSNLIISNSLLSDGSKILKTVNAGILIKKFRSSGLTESQAIDLANPIKVESNILYNTNYSYISYLIPGLTTFSLMIIIILGAIPIISHKLDHKEFSDFLSKTNNNVSLILFGKSLPHLAFHFANILVLVGIIFPLFNIHTTASAFAVLMYLFFFVIVCLVFGLMLGALIYKRVLATEAALFILMPAFIYSGLTFPLWAMPEIHQIIAKMIPFTYFLSGFIKIFQMNADFHYMINDLLFLVSFLIISFIITIISIKIRLIRINRV